MACNDQSESSAGLKVRNDRMYRRVGESGEANLRSALAHSTLTTRHEIHSKPHTTIRRLQEAYSHLYVVILSPSSSSVTWKPDRDSKTEQAVSFCSRRQWHRGRHFLPFDPASPFFVKGTYIDAHNLSKQNSPFPPLNKLTDPLNNQYTNPGHIGTHQQWTNGQITTTPSNRFKMVTSLN
jgi:hypothetical protein